MNRTVQTFGPPSYFDPVERQDALLAELSGWLGTPFQARAGRRARPQAACDCVSFVAAVLIALGAIRPFAWPSYVVRGGGAPMRELMLATLDAIPELVRLPPPTPVELDAVLRPGDLIASSSGRALHHLAIFGGDKTVWHALEDYGVCTGNLHDPHLREHLIGIYRARP